MGLFSSTKTFVASSILNLAGPLNLRPNFLKSVVAGTVLTNVKSIPEGIRTAYASGPGRNLQKFFKWATANYTPIGVPGQRLGANPVIDQEILAANCPNPSGGDVIIERYEIDTGGYIYWAEQYILDNRPDQIDTSWTADIVNGVITITYADATTATFTPVDLLRGVYIFTYYSVKTDAAETTKLFIYKIGSGNVALDGMIAVNEYEGPEFYPMLPIRLDNKFITDPSFDSTYPDLVREALKRSTGNDLDDLIAQIDAQDSVDDMDYAYVAFGVSVNTEEKVGLEYVYDFMDKIRSSQTLGPAQIIAWHQAQGDWDQWQIDRQIWEDEFQQWVANGKQASEKPIRPKEPPFPYLKRNNITVATQGALSANYDMELHWVSMEKLFGTGLAKTGAEAGEIWWDFVSSESYPENTWFAGYSINTDPIVLDTYRIYKQIDNNEWEAIEIVGLVHRNWIYNDKCVEITLKDALADSEESGFIIPLHYPTLKDMSITHSTQLAGSCMYLVVNSYEVVKTNILGSILVTVVIIAALIAVAVLAPEIAPGLVSAAMTTGTAIGLTGTAALIAGIVVNSIAATIITHILTEAAVAAFGEEIGQIIGMIASVVALNSLGNMLQTGQFAVNFGNMLSAENLLKLTDSVGNIAIHSATLDKVHATEDLIKQYEKESENISDLYAKNIGSDMGIIDPFLLLDTNGVRMETPDMFLSRTLMTGSDIARASLDMLSSFSDLTLSTKLPLTS